MNREETVSKMRSLVADSLALKPEEVRADSRLIADLGADSLDFVDLMFMIEKAFGVKIREGELDFISRLDFSSPEVMRGGFLTAATIDRLKPLLPALGSVPDPAKVTPAQLFSLISVETLCVIVERKLLTPNL